MKENEIIQSVQVALPSILGEVPFLNIIMNQLSELKSGADMILEVRIQDVDCSLIKGVKMVSRELCAWQSISLKISS